MNFIKPIESCHCSEVVTGVLASKEVKTGKLKGRHAICIIPSTRCRIGDEQVLKDNTIGILLREGEKLFMPVTPTRFDQLYINGACDLVEFF